MSTNANTLENEYTRALEIYVRDRSEASIAAAGDLGKKALSLGWGILDMVVLHHESLAVLIVGEESEERRKDVVDDSAAFFCEALSSFEMSHRGFIELSQTVSQIIQFAAVVCHELRTPLTSMMTSVGMLGEIIPGAPEGVERQLLANISRSADILKARTDDLLDLVGFQSGSLTLKPAEVDLAGIVRETAETMKSQIEKAGVESRLDFAEDLPPIVVDPNRVEQVVSNLIQNALKYGADGGRIDLRVYRAGETLVIEVKDYGAGVSLWDQMKIFQPNFRGSRAQGDVPGLGIGLALCKELVSQHHGTITLESVEGKGSLFRVALPLASAQKRGVKGNEIRNSRGRSGSR